MGRIAALFLFLGDAVAIILSIVLAYVLRSIVLEPNDIALSRYLLFWPFYTPLLLFAYEGLYANRYDFWQETRLVLKALVLSLLIVLSFLAITKHIEHYSRFVVVVSFVVMSFVLPLQKRVLKWLLFQLGFWKKEVKLYGADPLLERAIFDNYYLGYIKGEGHTIFINSRNLPVPRIEHILKEQIRQHHELYFIPLLQDFNLADSQILELFNSRTNLIHLQNRLHDKKNVLAKEVFDYLVAVMLLLLFSPFLLLIAGAIWGNDPRSPIFFRQKRLGKGGRIFTILKFRTMHEDAEAILQKYLQDHPKELKKWKKYKKLPDDPRVTSIGKILRKFSLDELPQLLNVIRGEMSLVGPRPYIPQELEKMREAKEVILSVRPGMTGLWQVLGRNRLTFDQRLRIDIWYVYNWSLWRDVVILLKTFWTVLKRDGAH